MALKRSPSNWTNKIPWVFFSGWLIWISPTVLTWVQLKSELKAKQEQLQHSQQNQKELQQDIHALKTHRLTQIREIHKVLGYLAPDELVFDFRPSLPKKSDFKKNVHSR